MLPRPVAAARCALLWCALTCALALTPSSALAKAEAHAELTAALVWDDNPPVAGPRSELYFDLRPRFALEVTEPRLVLRFAHTFLAGLYVDRDSADTWGNQLELSILLRLSRRASLAVSALGLEASLANFTLAQPTATTTALAAPTGTSYFVSALAQAEVGVDLTPRWRASQSIAFNALAPLPSLSVGGGVAGAAALATSYELDSITQLERAFVHDLAAGRLLANVIDVPEQRGRVTLADGSVDPDGQLALDHGLLLLAITGRWRHDFGAYFSSELELGPLVALKIDASPSTTPATTAQPVGVAALHYVRQEGQIDLSYSHQVQANAFLAQTFVNDWLALRGSVPIPGRRLHLVAAASVAYQHGQILGAGSRIDTGLVDTSLYWSPRPEIQVYARYQLIDQVGDARDTPALPSLLRNVIVLGLVGIYPPQQARPVTLAPSVRADRGDDPPLLR